jgi:16S rRNA G966 N2-methylase RsmD
VLKNPLKLDSNLLKLVVNQAVFNQTLGSKVPDWNNGKDLIAPPKISLEQCSSQSTAKYKANRINGDIGVDLTGGLGVDSYFFSKKFKDFTHNEINQNLSNVVKHNFEKLGIKNVKFTNIEAEKFEIGESVDFVYLDPARRDTVNRKMVSLKDCLPNLLEIKDLILSKAKILMVKYSPMLDIKDSILLLKTVDEVLILSEKNEVKELVFILKKELNTEPLITCVNLLSGQTPFAFRYSHESSVNLAFRDPEGYLYEPNASIMKAGAFRSIAEAYKISKIAANSHLYSSSECILDFPGRIFEIEEVVDFDKKQIKKLLKSDKANIAVRNFPYSTEEIKKQLGLKDGGDKYIFFSENHKKKKIVLICNKIQNTLK